MSNPNDPTIIYLEPYPGSPDGRMWCEDPVWDEIPECEGQSVRYVRAERSAGHSEWCNGGCGDGGLSSASRDYCPDARKALGSRDSDHA